MSLQKGRPNKSNETADVSDALQSSSCRTTYRPTSKVSTDLKTTRETMNRFNRTGIKYTTISQFLQLHDAPPEIIANELLHDLKSFQKVILNSKKIGERRGDMFKVLSILLKLTQVDKDKQSIANRVLAEAFNSRSCQFCFKLQQYVQAIRSTVELTFTISLFDAILKLLPSSWEVLPIEDLKEAVSNYAPLLSTDASYLSMAAVYQDAKQCLALGNTVLKRDHSEYRNIAILPTTSEISEFLPPKLDPNIVEGSYDSWEHYYDVQFKLLREDFVAPLRRGVCGYREGLRGRDISDVRVYYNVKFTNLEFSTDGIIISVQLDSSRLQRINWEHSKRLIYGSLLCFSYNNFESVIFASVAGRDAKELKEGLFTIKMESNTDVLNLMLNTNDQYTMIESQAHYESCYHILCSLQNAEVDTMPFTDILIKARCWEVEPPTYLQLCSTDTNSIDHPKQVFHMKDALGMKDDRISIFDISRPECWPNVEQVQLDQSQLDAIKMALTQKVSVIQGPPGTGKTYIGIKIVQALLRNRSIWDSARNSPILVVCYTNHALDQFLEEIINLKMFSVIRIGSRCQNEKVARFGIKKIEIRRSKIPRNVYRETWDKKDNVRNTGVYLDCRFRVFQETSEPFFRDLIEFIAPIHRAQLCAFVRDRLKANSDEQCFKHVDRSPWWKGTQDDNTNNFDDDDDDDDDDDGNDDNDDNNDDDNDDHENNDDDDIRFSYNNVDTLCEGLDQWLKGNGCDENEDKLIAENENELTAENTSSREPESSDDESTQSDVLENNNGDGISESGDEDDDSTVNVLGEAEIAEAERMVDQPAAIFKYEDVGDKISRANTVNRSHKHVRGFTHDTVNRIDNVFKLSKHNRLQLYNYWKGQYIAKLSNELHADFEEYLTLCKEYQEATQEEDLHVLEKVDLIGMTTTGAAKYQHILQRLKPKIIVVEEAAEVLESHVVSCLTAATQQLILIGDHKQLRPNPNEYHLARDCNLDISLFERLIRAGISHATLEIQHRMRPEIAGLVCPHIYPKLLNHKSVLQYENIQGVTTNMYFFHHEYPEVENDELRSHSNPEEAKLVVELCRYLLKQGYSHSKITVLTTYTSQLLKLKRLMPRDVFEGIRISAVDNFQGEENDIILLSLVRSNTNGRVGFLSIENRICVALSRAKKGFYCFGNFTLLRKSSETWKSILQYLEEQGKVGSCLTLCCFNHPNTRTEIRTIDDFMNVPQGGCDKLCDVRLECGHVCKLYCHPVDRNHEYYVCNQPCSKRCDSGHPCRNLCSQSCRACTVIVPKTMPICGHNQNIPCYVKPEHFKCQAPCTKKCEQGHLCSKLCSQKCGSCTTIVPKEHPICGHMQDVYCHMNPALCKCQYPCEKSCSTNPDDPHRCKKLCWLPCGDCEVPVLKNLPQCGHDQWVQCYRNPIYHTCQEPCNRKLSCGHPCTNKCGMRCTTKCEVEVPKILHCKHTVVLLCSESIDNVMCQIEIEKTFPVCGHSIVLPCCLPISEENCQVKVHRTLPCGHKTFMKCSIQIKDFKCNSKIKISLNCGHVFEGLCYKKDEKCKVLSVKKFPGCGHQIKLPCHEDIPAQCAEKCNATLLCGHQCSGNCSECHQGRLHKPCAYHMSPLPCGHPSPEICTSIAFPLCQYKCTHSCAHRKVCTHDCGKPCNPCKERCSWNCPHFKCTKKCYEMCNRPRCNHPCKQILQCRHPCIGICGEPCPRVCRICKKQKKTFYKWCVSTPSMNSKNENRYIQLICNHLFEVKELDQLLDDQFKNNAIVEPLACPECGKEIHFSYRYGDLVRKKKENIQIIRDTMFESATVDQQQAIIEKVLSHFVPEIEYTEDILHNEVERLLKRKAKYLPVVFKKPKRYLLASSLKGIQASILENEIDQYMLLKQYEPLYEQYPDLLASLQSLLTFFVKTPPSAQKSQDVSCERKRIFLLWMIYGLTSVTVPQEHYIVIQQLKEKLTVNDSKLTLPTLDAHYDKLQAIAQKLGKRFKVDEKHMQSSKTITYNGVWRICPNSHVYCKPRGFTASGDDHEWQCPDCL